MADGSRHSLFHIPEVTYAVTPTTPEFKKCRYVTCTLGITKDSLKSSELRSDRQIADFRLGQNKVGGAITGELSMDPELQTFLEATLGGTWTENVLKVGTTRRSFSFLRHFEDMANTEKAWMLLNGGEFSTLSITASAGKIATYSADVIGKGFAIATAAPTGATFDAASSVPVMDAFTGTISEGGSAIAVVTEVQMKLDNGMDRKFVLGSKDTLHPQQGVSDVSGSISAYFESTALFEKFLAESATSLSFQLSNGSSSYTFSLPNLKYTSGQPDVSSAGAVLATMNFQAVLSPTDGTQLSITRATGV